MADSGVQCILKRCSCYARRGGRFDVVTVYCCPQEQGLNDKALARARSSLETCVTAYDLLLSIRWLLCKFAIDLS